MGVLRWSEYIREERDEYTPLSLIELYVLEGKFTLDRRQLRLHRLLLLLEQLLLLV